MSNSPAGEEHPRSSYSKEELVDMYALTKMFLETGQIKRAEVIARGLTTVAPEFVPGWLALSVVSATQGNIETALEAGRKALKYQPDSTAAMMLIVTSAMTLGDLGTAGTYLGELKEMIDQGSISDPNVLRLYKMQMARYGQGK
jgi:predicted Zn-dependent protease